ncbi:MAG: sigma-E factor negative regulatory protein [Polaromonas sp.]|nr:sigma-E factor negative regulatory protein [Polaromonas sp.]
MNTMKPTTQNLELISALADGQLASDDFAAVLAVCEADDQALASWNAYHLIGDVLRSPGLASQVSDAAFLTRLRTRLADEPAIDARREVPAVSAAVTAMPGAWTDAGREASNDSSFRLKLVAGFVSVAAVVAVAWSTGPTLLAPSAAPQLAQSTTPQLARPEAPQQVLVMSAQGPVVRDARLQQLLAEHKQFGGTSALQMPSGFLRNATFESPQDARR